MSGAAVLTPQALERLEVAAVGEGRRSSGVSLSSTDEDGLSACDTSHASRPVIFVSSVCDGLPLPLPAQHGKLEASGSQDAERTGPSLRHQPSTTPTSTPALDYLAQPLNKRNDNKSQPRTPYKPDAPKTEHRLSEIVPKMNQSRNIKFHKLFKELPQEEICIKGYSCAFCGDILIQGYLYISPNWFCFHSKILGIEKQIKIPVHKVLNITREKTAIFIPNAIGVVTSEDKYVFGSLLSRDNTYRLMYTVWKTLTQPDAVSKPNLADQFDISIDDGEQGEHNNNMHKQNASLDSSESENSVCIQCGAPVVEHSGGEPCDDDAPTGDSPPTPVHPPPATPAMTSTPSSAAPPPSSTTTSSSNTQVVEEASTSVMKSVLHTVTSIPKTHLLLSLCIVLVLALACSAVIMLHKILLLQAKLDGDQHGLPLDSDQGLYNSMYYLNQEYHMSSIRRFHSVLEANIQVLDQIFSSLKGLQTSVLESEAGCVTSGQPGVDDLELRKTT